MIFIINQQKTYPLLLIATLALSSMLIKKKKKLWKNGPKQRQSMILPAGHEEKQD